MHETLAPPHAPARSGSRWAILARRNRGGAYASITLAMLANYGAFLSFTYTLQGIEHLSPAGRVPHPGRAIGAAGHDPLTVRREAGSVHDARMSPEGE